MSSIAKARGAVLGKNHELAADIILDLIDCEDEFESGTPRDSIVAFLEGYCASPPSYEQGKREGIEAAAKVAAENKSYWAEKCDPLNDEPSQNIYRAKSAACFQVEMDIRALKGEARLLHDLNDRPSGSGGQS